MIDFSLMDFSDENQYCPSQFVEIIDNQVMCPMCEICHENNTNCQRSF